MENLEVEDEGRKAGMLKGVSDPQHIEYLNETKTLSPFRPSFSEFHHGEFFARRLALTGSLPKFPAPCLPRSAHLPSTSFHDSTPTILSITMDLEKDK